AGSPHTNGSIHVGKVAQSRLHGEIRLARFGGWHTTRRHHLPSAGQYDARRVGKTPSGEVPAQRARQQQGKKKQSASGAICGRLHHHGQLTKVARNRSQTPRDRISPRARLGTLTREDQDNAHRGRFRLSRTKYPEV